MISLFVAQKNVTKALNPDRKLKSHLAHVITDHSVFNSDLDAIIGAKPQFHECYIVVVVIWPHVVDSSYARDQRIGDFIHLLNVDRIIKSFIHHHDTELNVVVLCFDLLEKVLLLWRANLYIEF